MIEVAVKQTGSAAAHASLVRAFKWRDGSSIGQIKVCSCCMASPSHVRLDQGAGTLEGSHGSMRDLTDLRKGACPSLGGGMVRSSQQLCHAVDQTQGAALRLKAWISVLSMITQLQLANHRDVGKS